MAYIDAQNQYASAQTLTSTGATTNIVDHGVDGDIGIGEGLAVVITVTAIDATSSDETYAAQVQASSASNFGSPVSVGGSVSISRSIAVPAQVVIPIPPDTTMDRYSRVNFTLGGTTPSITFSAEIRPSKDVQNFVVHSVGTHIQ